jgi:hypothetical protein
MIRRPRDAKRQRLVQHLVVPRGLVVRMQKQMRMALDHPGHQRRSFEVDACAASGQREGIRKASGRDPVAANQHGPPLVHVESVEDPIGEQQSRGGGVGPRGVALCAAGSGQADRRDT